MTIYTKLKTAITHDQGIAIFPENVSSAERKAYFIICELNDRKGLHIDMLDDETQDEIFGRFVVIIALQL